MNILIACNEKYLALAEKMLFSLHEHNGILNVYLIHENLSDESIDKFNEFFLKYDIGTLNIIEFDSSTITLPLSDKDSVTGHITKEAYFRLYAPFFLPEDMERILYLDCDIICTGDISELYNIDFAEKTLVGCQNIDLDNSLYVERLGLPEGSTYINSGVLLFNLELYKKYASIDKLNSFILEHANELDFQDQDVINMMFHDKILLTNIMYNFQINSILYTEGGVLIHYTGRFKPWNDDYYRPILAKPFYDVLLKLGEEDEMKKKKKLHEKNFSDVMKFISVVVFADNVTDEIMHDIVRQSETFVEFVIVYNSVEEGLIEKYVSEDCRLVFIQNHEFESTPQFLKGRYVTVLNANDFKNMDVHFLRELIYFSAYNRLVVTFYNCFDITGINDRIIEIEDELDDQYMNDLISNNADYHSLYLNNLTEVESKKVGYREKMEQN